jgi:Got1/Sft2-like family
MLFLASWAVLMGPRQYAQHLMSGSRLPFTAAYFGSIALTIYFAIGVSENLFPSNTSKLSSQPTPWLFRIVSIMLLRRWSLFSFLYFDRGVSDAAQPLITILLLILQGRCAWAAVGHSSRVSTWMRRRLDVLSLLESALIDLQLALIGSTLLGINSTNDSSSSYTPPS